MKKYTAIHIRVSTSQQSTRSQKPDLQRWIDSQGPDTSVKWFHDSATGKTMDRPGWIRLEKVIEVGADFLYVDLCDYGLNSGFVRLLLPLSMFFVIHLTRLKRIL